MVKECNVRNGWKRRLYVVVDYTRCGGGTIRNFSFGSQFLRNCGDRTLRIEEFSY